MANHVSSTNEKKDSQVVMKYLENNRYKAITINPNAN